MTTTADSLADAIREAIRDVPDFPKPGVMFKDITPLLGNEALFRETTLAMAEPFRSAGVTHVAAIESRGFLLGAPIAQHLRAGVIPIRKPGKLPSKTSSIEYALEYGVDRLEMHTDACGSAARILVVDDVLATGGTAAAAGALVRSLGGAVVGFSFLMTLSFLAGEKRLSSERVTQLVRY